MGFGENLIKGFIRSAVNQVGRDGGRVISNKVYRNAHSSPVRITNDTIEGDSIVVNEQEITIADLKSNGYKPEYFKDGVLKYVGLLVGSLIIPLLGPIMWLYMAHNNLFAKGIAYYINSSETTYTKDRRYSTGMRPSGNATVKRYFNALVQPTPLERTLLVIKAIISLIICIYIAIFQWSFIQELFK